jgi:hypothetical protein
MRTAFVIGSFLLLLAPFTTAACGDDPEEVVNRVTCGDVCRRYADCFDSDYDVQACTDRCTSDATASEEKEERLELCNECIDEESCAGAVFNCTTECTPFVP